MEIVRLNIDDYEEICSLWMESGLPIKAKGRDSKESIAYQMKKDPDAFIGVRDLDRLVGVVIATSDGRKGWINRLSVHPEYRRRGIGTILIEQSIKKFKKEHLGIYAALIEDYNNSSMQLFKKTGFTEHRDIIYYTKRINNDI
ncbi:MAG: GNAT family N-acetyltransferase [Candidatus Thermoplasmatota archaeon]|jgi:ribosomal protein S18 acetylase RimI-like enzyme|nr:GNAT family N-acetyltransferase [Candidatus Thermoplasmatota archaeon]MCL5964134.1 GNAT family N-acetyltransferase [Candidatus Thermoplasmatota archaeon]